MARPHSLQSGVGPEPALEAGTLSPGSAAVDSWVDPRATSARPAPVVELRRLGRTYGSDPPVEALRSVDLAIDAGALSDEQRAALRGRSIGFVFQTFHLLPHRTALENVMLAEVYAGGEREGRRERALAALERVGMADRADFLPTKLSGGQQQRVAIARALLASPKLLLCDEPTGNLDSANTESLLGLFEALWREGLTLVVITHDDGVATHARRIVHIVDGRLTEETR